MEIEKVKKLHKMAFKKSDIEMQKFYTQSVNTLSPRDKLILNTMCNCYYFLMHNTIISINNHLIRVFNKDLTKKKKQN